MMQPNDNSIQWFQAEAAQKINGVALVVHGLNLRPDKMGSIIDLLTDSGIEVLNLSLRGHGDNYPRVPGIDENRARMEAFKTVSYQVWLDETHRAYHLAGRRSNDQKVPLFFVGFSLGGLLGGDLLASRPDVHFDKMILLAPALSLYASRYVLKLFSPFPRLLLPNYLLKFYRANSGTPMAAYNSLLKALDHFEQNVNRKLNIPTLIFMDKKDELVSYRGLKRLIQDGHLDQWKFLLVKKRKSGVEVRMRHVIVDEPSVGKETWNEMRIAVNKHLLHESDSL